MKLSDIVGHWDLAMYPKVALVIFLVVFFCVVLRLYVLPGGRRLQQFSTMAIEDETTTREPSGRNE